MKIQVRKKSKIVLSIIMSVLILTIGIFALPEPVKAVKDNGDGNKLEVKVGGNGQPFVDVDTLSLNTMDWDITSSTFRQLYIKADFSNVGAAKDRIIEVSLPRGYVIKEYSAKTGTPTYAGVTQLGFSPTAESKVLSSNLTAIDGTPWANQKISGYAPPGTKVAADVKLANGKIIYELNDNCDFIELTITYDLNEKLLPHKGTDYLMDPIAVDMKSDTLNLSTNLKTNVKRLVNARLVAAQNPWGDGLQLVDPITKLTEVFTPGYSISMFDNFSQTAMLDTLNLEISYPEGVWYKGFTEGITNASETLNFNGGTYSNGFLVVEVTEDSVNGGGILKF
ncbi:MAG: hypothetical protein ACRCUS_05460, partial [Anaerovoracaceae bacterium]